MVRLGLIGCGRWGRIYLKTIASLSDVCKLSVLGTSRPENAALVGDETILKADWRQVVDPRLVDAVLIATPPGQHAEMAALAFENGLPCVIEKPLTLSSSEAKALCEKADQYGVPVLVNHIQLFSPAYIELQKLLHSRNESPLYISSEGGSWGPFRTDTPAAWDWLPHDLSLCFDLMKSAPTLLQGAGSGMFGDYADITSLSLKFSGERAAWIHSGRLMPEKRRQLLVVTDKNSYWLNDLSDVKLSERSGGMKDRYQNPGIGNAESWKAITIQDKRTSMQAMLQTFIAGLSGGSRERFGLGLALSIVQTIESGLKSNFH